MCKTPNRKISVVIINAKFGLIKAHKFIVILNSSMFCRK